MVQWVHGVHVHTHILLRGTRDPGDPWGDPRSRLLASCPEVTTPPYVLTSIDAQRMLVLLPELARCSSLPVDSLTHSAEAGDPRLGSMP